MYYDYETRPPTNTYKRYDSHIGNPSVYFTLHIIRKHPLPGRIRNYEQIYQNKNRTNVA